MDSNELIDKIKSGDQKAFEQIYIAYRDEFLQWAVSINSIGLEDAKDVYQQSVISLYENIVNGRLMNMKSNLRTYLFAIGKNKYTEMIRNQKNKNFEIVTDVQDQSPAAIEQHEDRERIIALSESSLSKIGNPCKELLELYYFHMKSVPEITEILGYKNVETTKNLKYKCLNRLKEIFLEELKNNKIPLYE